MSSLVRSSFLPDLPARPRRIVEPRTLVLGVLVVGELAPGELQREAQQHRGSLVGAGAVAGLCHAILRLELRVGRLAG